MRYPQESYPTFPGPPGGAGEYQAPPPPPRPGFEQGYGGPPPPTAGYQGYFGDGQSYQGYQAAQSTGPILRRPIDPYDYSRSSYDQYGDQDGCSSILRACMAALCCCCLMEQCCR